MAPSAAKIPAARVVVIMPNWLGDGVMATPFLRALRDLYPAAKIAAVARPLVASVLSGLPFVDETFVEEKGETAPTQRFLHQGHFDLGVLLPNSFRSAWGLWRGRVVHRLGYARDWRTPLLTRRVNPMLRNFQQRQADAAKEAAILRISSEDLRQPVKVHVGSSYQPVPTIDYYLELARNLGADELLDRRMELGVTDTERAQAQEVLRNHAPAGATRITMVPGANFGSSKCWPPEYFAQVADAMIESRDATILLAGSPAEIPIVDAILKATKHPDRVVALAKLNDGRGVSLGALKEIVRGSALMVANDTGPRHFAAAFGVPVVTLFGPTDPVWAQTFAERDRHVRIEVPCGPCQLKKCPIDHRCMTRLKPEMVLQATADILLEHSQPDSDADFTFLFRKRHLAKSTLTMDDRRLVLLFDAFEAKFLPPHDPYAVVLQFLHARGSSRNIFCFAPSGELLWQVEHYPSSHGSNAFIGTLEWTENGSIEARTWSGHIYQINPANGALSLIGWTK